MNRRQTIVACAVFAALSAGVTGGCVNRGPWGWGSPSPEVLTLAETGGMAGNKLSTNTDLGRRMIVEDAARVLHMGRPSRLSPAPVPY